MRRGTFAATTLTTLVSLLTALALAAPVALAREGAITLGDPAQSLAAALDPSAPAPIALGGDADATPAPDPTTASPSPSAQPTLGSPLTQDLTPTPAADTQLAAQAARAKRTIMLYDCGSNLETDSGMASYNLRQILAANFSHDDSVRFVVMTGGAMRWQLESSYLADPNGLGLETSDETGEPTISGTYCQIWEAKGADAPENPSKLVLLDKDGPSGDGPDAKTNEEALMSDPETLKSFINYGVQNFPADKYDLILWDHGSGPNGGWCQDDNDIYEEMSLDEIVDVLQDNDVTRDGGTFDFIDFDACLMGSVEVVAGIADYTDYYVASPETEPGYGQPYTDWLDRLGADPTLDTFELGKSIVDDFLAFYGDQQGDGDGYDGTLCVLDTKKLVASDLYPALNDLSGLLRKELTTASADGHLFYDELASVAGALDYAGDGYVDLGSMASLLAVASKEAKAQDIEAGSYNTTNAYKDISQRILSVLSDEDVIYAGGTEGIATDEQFYMGADGVIDYDRLATSGLYVYFAPTSGVFGSRYYTENMDDVLAKMPHQDARTTFLSEYPLTMCHYMLCYLTGQGVNTLINGMDVPREDVDYDAVATLDWNKGGEYGFWRYNISPVMDMLGGEAAVRPWLETLVLQQAKEAIAKDNVSSWAIDETLGMGHKVKIQNTAKRIIDGVNVNLVAELPGLEAYIKQVEKDDPMAAEDLRGLSKEYALRVGTIEGERDWDMSWDDIETIEDLQRRYSEWYGNDTSLWNVPAVENKWWSVCDAQGYHHAAQISRDGETICIPMVLQMQNDTPVVVDVPEDWGSFDEQLPQLVYLGFRDGELTEIRFMTNYRSFTYRGIPAKELTSRLKLTPVRFIKMLSSFYFLPLSASSFELTPENVDSVRLEYTDIDNIDDIADTTGDGEKLTPQFVVTDIYGNEIDITEQVLAHKNGTLTNIEKATVEDVYYNGKEQAPKVTCDGKELIEGVDFELETLAYAPLQEGADAQGDGSLAAQADDTETGELGDLDEPKRIEVGTYKIALYGMGSYGGMKVTSFNILPVPDDGSTDPGTDDGTDKDDDKGSIKDNGKDSNKNNGKGSNSGKQGTNKSDSSKKSSANASKQSNKSSSGSGNSSSGSTATSSNRTTPSSGSSSSNSGSTYTSGTDAKPLATTADESPRAAVALLAAAGAFLLACGAAFRRKAASHEE